MERLTERFSNDQAAVAGCGNNCKFNYKYCEDNFAGNCPTLTEIYEKLAEYEDLEEQGLLLRLPYNLETCGVIYCLDEKDSEIYRLTADKIEISKTMISKRFLLTIDSFEFFLEDFGKIVFLTKAEAEEALKKMESEHE